MVVDPTGVKVHVKFGDSRSKRSRDIGLPHFVQPTMTTRTDPKTIGQNAAKRQFGEFTVKHYTA